MIRWLRSLFAWRMVRRSGAYAYYENAVTGQRWAGRWADGGWSPIDHDWLLRREPRPRVPPTGGSSVAPPPIGGRL